MADFYALITSFPEGGLPNDLAERSSKVASAIADEIPSLNGKWVADWALDDGDIHAIDIVVADDRADVEKAAALIQQHGGCEVRVAGARTWTHAVGSHLSAAGA